MSTIEERITLLESWAHRHHEAVNEPERGQSAYIESMDHATGPDETFTITAEWVDISRNPEQAGWYYTRDKCQVLSMRYFDDSDGSWSVYSNGHDVQTLVPSNCFVAWLSLQGITSGWKAAVSPEEPQESHEAWLTRQREKAQAMERDLNEYDRRLSAARHALYMWGVPETDPRDKHAMDVAERIHWLHDNLLKQVASMGEQAGTWQARYEQLAKRFEESELRHAEEMEKARIERIQLRERVEKAEATHA
ncbi:MAG: hypothetical protein ACYDCO_26545 [Armatimonadota bacterium]